ncbi:MAG: DNA topoisomerase I [Candidatus Woesearchaeota archaeon]
MKLIIAEKPSAANKIAFALADGEIERKKYYKSVNYYEIDHSGDDILVASAVGHLYTLSEDNKSKKWKYPVFDISWKPIYDVRKKVNYAKKYLKFLKKQEGKVDEVIIATDYDTEGEVIGLNVMKYALGRDDASRMKFSTLTKSDLIDAYENRKKTINWGQGLAGETRHFLDWYYGINLSRALSLAYQNYSDKWGVLSTGRVQGPALKLIVDKEREIQAFEPETYWELYLINELFEAKHKKKRFKDEKEVKEIYEKIKKTKVGEITSVKKRKKTVRPPHPFDLSSLQSSAYRFFKIKPQQTLKLAQNLYLAGVISYPRTSSQKLNSKIGYKDILKKLGNNKKYKRYSEHLLNKKKKLSPNNGKKNDPAHPAIYPTGQLKKLKKNEQKIYDLIVKRFFATFGKSAKRESMRFNIKVHDEIFRASGTHTIDRGWFDLYEPYLNLKEEEFPEYSKGDVIKVKKINLEEKETQPPNRFSPSSIVKKLEKKGLGTKATRSQIVESLYDRNYVTGDKSIEPTKLAFRTIESLEEYAPQILSDDLTSKFENKMEEIRKENEEPKKVLKEAKKLLKEILDEFKEKENEIGEKLNDAVAQTKRDINNFGKCPKCGSALTTRKGKYGKFIACTNYPDCKFTFNLPNRAKGLKMLDEECEHCSSKLFFARAGRKVGKFCINPECPDNKKKNKEVDKKCPKCGSPLVYRKTIFGSFYGCSNFPKCKYIDGNDEKDKDSKKKKGSNKKSKSKR